MWTTNPIYIGAHFWFVPDGTAYTSPGPGGVVAQNGTWPDEAEPLWPDWKLGICESFEIDPKYGSREEILEPSPGAVQATNVVIPYTIPEVKLTMLTVPSLAVQLALNTESIWGTANTALVPNAGGGPGVRGILRCQAYDQDDNLLKAWTSWAFMQLSGTFKGAPKNMTRADFMATLLKSVNNDGQV